ncbi:antitoxin component of MazEF toxin-antitoxin module [Bradyrhizobium diazoefficiens]
MVFSAVSSRCFSSESRRVTWRKIRNQRQDEKADRQHGHGDEEFRLRAPGGERRVQRPGRNDHQRRAGQEAGGDDAVLAVDRARELHRDEGALEHGFLLGGAGVVVLPDHRVDMRNARKQLAVLVVHRDRGIVAEPRRGKEGFELVGRDRARDHAEEFAMGAGDAPREHDRRSVAEPSGHDLDLLLRGRVGFEAVEIAAVGDRDVGDRPAPRRVDERAVGVEHIGAGDVGPAAGFCAQRLVHGEGAHLAAEDVGGGDAVAFELGDDALLEHREIRELAVEMADQQADGTLQAVAAALDRILPEAVDGERGADGGCSHQHEAADDQPCQRRPAPTAQQRAHPRGPSDRCAHPALPWDARCSKTDKTPLPVRVTKI